MTDKIIAHGIDVSDCFHRCENMECLVYTVLDGMPTCNCNNNFVKNCYYKQLKRKEHECEYWKHQAELGNETTNRLAKQLQEKEQECEELKQELKELKEAITNFCGCKTRDEFDIPICEDTEKYKKALDEIENIADDYNRVCKTSQYYRDGFDQIQDIINKTKEE